MSEVKIDDTEIMRLWREAGLPEYFLGNGGTNEKLVTFAGLISANSHARLVECLGELLSDHYKAHVYEAWCDADKPNGRSAQREVDAIEDKARTLIKELSHERA